MTPEMEKLIKAIMPFVCQDDADLESQFRACVPEYCQCRKAISAALEAIREPSEGMLHAMGVDHAKERYVPIQEQNVIDGYVAAIDHILGKEPTP